MQVLLNDFVETVQLSKAAMKNKKRAEKRSKARIQQIKENGIMSEEIEMKDPLAILRQQLQEAKDRKVCQHTTERNI